MTKQLKESLMVTKFMGTLGLFVSTVLIVCQTILLIRMNNQTCIPEMSMWEFYKGTSLIAYPVGYAIAGFIFYWIFAGLDYLYNKFNLSKIKLPSIHIPMWVNYIWLGFAILILIALLAVLFWGLFIKNPC